MAAGTDPGSPVSRRARRSGAFLRYAGRGAAAIVALYAVLLIPIGEGESLPSGGRQEQKQAFVWDRDEYWMTLESAYRTLKQGGCGTAVPDLASQFQNAKKALQLIDRTRLGPQDRIFRELESMVFGIGPVVSACNAQVMEYIGLIADMRTVIKKRSRDWDMNSAAARNTLYRLLYGSRAAAEEVMLQVPASAMLTLVLGADEPSRTPGADVRKAKLHSGDILVSRGGAPTSALIARGADYPGNFSHIALVYVDPGTHMPFIVEAHIERGVVVSTMDQYLEDKKLRIMLLRPRADLPQLVTDPMTPHKAAERAYSRARTEHVPYDFEMNYRDHRKLFCSEVVSSAYEPFGIDLWMGISRLSAPGLQKWLSAFGVKYFETQEPSDLEYDPQLTVVGEWRDQETLRKDHYDNAVTEAMLEGAEQGDELAYQWYLLPLIRIAKAYSAGLNLMGKVGPVPEGMSATAALRNIWYSNRHDAIAARLATKAEQFRQDRGYWPPYWELVTLARSAKAEENGKH
ncbi:MAG: hypothetical protein HGA43_09985 [Nitrospirae bacterium]|nr:hypothetical protein [Nitrospirota bacterium]